MSVKLKNLLRDYNQEHLLTFWDELTEEQQKNLENDLISLDISEVCSYFTNAMASFDASKKLSDDKLKPLPDNLAEYYEKSSAEKLADYEEEGLKEISCNKVAVLLMAGGQGTRLGVNYPKGMYDVGLPSKRTLFHLQALRIKRLQNIVKDKYGKDPTITWYIMTSDATHDTTISYFKNNHYFGLQESNVIAFKQGTIPCFTFDGKIMLDEMHKISRAPNGNGGLYEALSKEGIIDDMKKRGINSIHAYSVDNILVKVADPIFIGYCLKRSADFGMKTVAKRSASEPVGVVCEVDGKYQIVEYSEMSAEKAASTNQDGELTFNYGNICNHYFSFTFLEKLSNNIKEKVDLHVAKKKIPCIDLNTGIKIHPDKPNGIKIEKFIFDVMKHTSNLAVWQVLRNEDFSALKNADSAKADCPSTARNDLVSLHKKWLLKAGAVEVESDVEICPLTSYNGENLVDHVKGKSFKGPVCLSFV